MMNSERRWIFLLSLLVVFSEILTVSVASEHPSIVPVFSSFFSFFFSNRNRGKIRCLDLNNSNC